MIWSKVINTQAKNFAYGTSTLFVNHPFRLIIEKSKDLKSIIVRTKTKEGNASKFAAIVNKYSDFEELTPEVIHAFIDKIFVHEKAKEGTHFRQTIEKVYNFVGAVEIPDFN